MGQNTLRGACLAASLLLAAPAPPVAAQAAPGDLKKTLFELANSMGMLRTLEQIDSVVTTEIWAKGMTTVGGRQMPVTDYRASINYVIPGMREDLKYTAADGKPARQIHVVAQGIAWDERERGMNASPATAAMRERLVRLWTTPPGVVKAATAAGDRSRLMVQEGATVLTFPLPAPVSDVMVRATLRDTKSMAALLKSHPKALPGLVGTYIVRVETTGGIVTDTTYSEYGDWNPPDYLSDVMLPRRIVQKRADGSVLDLTITETNTYNPYVVMPVPEGMAKPAAGSR